MDLKTILTLFLCCYPLCICAQVRPEFRLQTGHEAGYLNAAVISPNSKLVATSGLDEQVILWDTNTGRQLLTIQSGLGEILNLKFTQDGKYLFMTGGNGVFAAWDIEKSEFTIKKLIHNDVINEFDFHPNKPLMATASDDSTVIIWNINPLKKKHVLKGHQSPVNAVRFSPDGTTIVSGGDNGTVFQWNIDKGKLLNTYVLHTKNVKCLSFSWDGKYLASVGAEKNIKLWNYPSMLHVHTFEDKNGFEDACFTADNTYLLTAGAHIKVWDVLQKKYIGALVEHIDYTATINLSPDQKYLISASLDNTAILWNAYTGRKIMQFKSVAATKSYVSFHPDNQHWVSAENGSIKIWDYEKFRLTDRIPVYSKLEEGSYELPEGLFCLADNNLNLFYKYDKDIYVYSHFDSIYKLNLPMEDVRDMAISPNADMIALSGGDYNNVELTLVRISDGVVLFELLGHTGIVNSLDFSRDGKYLASSGSLDRTVRIWDVKTGEIKYIFFNDTVNNKQAEIDIKKRLLDGSFVRGGNVTNVKFSPDGRFIANSGDDQAIKLWDVHSGKLITILRGHSGMVNCVDFNADGSLLASGGNDRKIKIWNMNTLDEIITLEGHESYVKCVSFSKDGKQLLSSGYDHTVRLWDVPAGKLLLTLVSLPNKDDFVVYTPEGYYMSSKKGTDAVHFVMNKTVFLFDQFDLRFNRPDIILQCIGRADSSLVTAYRNAYKKRLKKMNFTEAIFHTGWQIPKVKIMNQDSIGFTTKSKRISLKINANDSVFSIDRINVWVNGVSLFGSGGVSLRSLNLMNVNRIFDIELSQGENKIEVSALNIAGAESLREAINIKNEPEIVNQPDLYLITIGASEYQNEKFNLTYAAKDATDLTTLLTTQKDKYWNIRTFQILNKNVSTENVSKVKQELMQSHVDDLVIVFYAGHGLLDENLNYYLATHNIDFKNPSKTGLAYEELENLLDGIPARKKLLLIDACHSGEVDKDEELFVMPKVDDIQNIVFRSDTTFRSFKPVTNISYINSFELMKELFADLRRGTGAVVISSAGGGEYAYEGADWKNGVFTYSLLEGLKTGNADLNKDGEILVSELRDYVFNQVSKLTGGKQNPTTRQENLDFDFRVW